MKNKNIVLFLNENPLPKIYTKGTIAGKELRLRATINSIDEVHVISRRGKTVQVQSEKEIGEIERKIHIHLMPTWPYYLAGLPLFFYGIYYYIKLKPKTVEAESPIISGPAAVLLGKLFNIPTIVEVRASYYELIKHKVKFIPYQIKKIILDFVYKTTLKSATKVIANSRYYQKQLKQHNISSIVINPGIQYSPQKKTHTKRNQTRIGTLSRLAPEKAIDQVIKAFSMLAEKLPTAQLYIAGEGPELKNLKNLVTKLNLEKRVVFKGFVNNYKLLSQINILVNANTVKHPLEMANAEAAYMRVPVICYGSKEYPETVIHNHTGLKVEEQNIKKLSQAITLLITNKSKHTQLATNSYKLYEKNYKFKDQVQKLKDIYESLNLFI